MFRTRAGSLQKGQFQFFPSFLWPLNLKAIHHFIVSFNFNTWPDTCCDLSQACNAIEEGYNPGITFIVAQKRHNTRFFPSNPQSRDILPKNGNVLPGYYSLLWQWYCFTFYAFEVYTWDQKSVFVTGLGWVNLAYMIKCSEGMQEQLLTRTSVIPTITISSLSAMRASLYISTSNLSLWFIYAIISGKR